MSLRLAVVQHDLEYAGDSAVIDPGGERLTSAASVEALLIVDVAADTVEKTRTEFPVLQIDETRERSHKRRISLTHNHIWRNSEFCRNANLRPKNRDSE